MRPIGAIVAARNAAVLGRLVQTAQPQRKLRRGPSRPCRTGMGTTTTVAALLHSSWLSSHRRRLPGRTTRGARCRRRGSLREWLAGKAGILSWSLALVWLIFFCDYVLMTMAIPIFPLLGKSEFFTGALFASKAFVQMLSSPFLVAVVDRYGKSMIIGGLAVEVFSLIIFACTFNYTTWLLARAASGVASAAIVSAGLAQVSRYYSDREQRAVAMGLATTGIISGVCLGPLLGGLLYEIWTALPFLVLVVFEVLVGLLALARLPRLRASVEDAGEEATVGEMLRCPEVLRPLGALTAANAAISCLEATVAHYLFQTFGFNAGQVGAMFLLVSVPSCLASGFAGPVGNRLGRANLVRWGLVIQGLFTMLGPKRFLLVEAASLLGLGLGMGIIDGAAPSLLGEVAEDRFKGTSKIFVLSNVAVQFGFVLGPLCGSAIAETGGFGACCLATGGALLVYAPLIVQRQPS